jgi:hypothetical protein
MTLPKEIWADVPGYEGHYQCSDIGRIRSLDKYVNGRNGKSLKKGKILKQHKRAKYLGVGLSMNGITKLRTVHTIVADTFIPNPENKPCVNHKDGNKYNNRKDNLERATYKENTQHYFEVIGVTFTPYFRKKARETILKMLESKKRKVLCNEDNATFDSITAAASHYGLTHGAIRYLIRNNGTSKAGKTFSFVN